MTLLPRLRPADVAAAAPTMPDATTHAIVASILADVQRDGLPAAVRHGVALGDLEPGRPVCFDRHALAAAAAALPIADRQLLQRTAARIRGFALAQRASLQPFELAVPGGIAAQRIAPVITAGCYAPGGRFPLPSSVLMTAVTARAAGVENVWVASPRPGPMILAAAHVAAADGVLALGGAQAIAALAVGGDGVPAADRIVGPGNRFVTAAKLQLAGRIGIDLPAGPSELVVVADATADPATVAADLLAQAEHDPDARPFLVTLAPELVDAVERCLDRQVQALPDPNARNARAALASGGSVVCMDLAHAAAICDRLAPEHLQLAGDTVQPLRDRVRHYGALFCGRAGAEVFGDYGIGPNHVLPTGGAARYSGGLSVFTFLRVRTELWLHGADPELLGDTAALAAHEGLAAHAAAATRRA